MRVRGVPLSRILRESDLNRILVRFFGRVTLDLWFLEGNPFSHQLRPSCAQTALPVQTNEL
jgi:hypothetical protein